MTPEEFTQKLASTEKELDRWTQNDAPRIFGKIAADIYARNFQMEGFQNNSLEPWLEVKRRTGAGKGAAASRKILTGETGNLGRSFHYQTGKGMVTIYNDARSGAGFPYGKVHNEGATDAGRKRSTVIPKRQIIGPSAEVDRVGNEVIARKLAKLRLPRPPSGF